MSADGDEEMAGFASPPCFMHEIDPAYSNGFGASDAQQRSDVMRWRRAERVRLLAVRKALPVKQKRSHDQAVLHHLRPLLERSDRPRVALYWPIQGEPDLRGLLQEVTQAGGRCALPVVERTGEPLVFRAWSQGARLVPGVWDIPVPLEGAEELRPDVVIAPLLGFDADSYRLGNGGGYYDRTLAVADPKPLVLGVGYEALRIPTIFAQPHDVPMDIVITEAGCWQRPDSVAAVRANSL